MDGGSHPDISHTSQSSSMEHMKVSVNAKCDPWPKHDSTTSITVSFNSVELMVSGVLFPPDEQTPFIALQSESGFIREKYRNSLLFGAGSGPFSVVR